MAIFEKIGDFAKNIGDKTQDAIETSKLNSKINGEKSAAAECMRKIGEYYYGKYRADGQSEAEVSELYAAIDGHYQAIADAEADIEKIKAENAAKSNADAPAPSAPASGGILCPSCGTPIPDGTSFCVGCGTKIEAAVPGGIPCPSCGKLNPEGMKFCVGCGSKMEAPAPLVCGNCGTQLSAGTGFCGACGHKIV